MLYSAWMPGPEVLLYGLPLAFLAGFVDSIAGGGGTITLPTLVFMGLSPAQTLATNKLLAIFGSGSATIQYWRKGYVHGPLIMRMIPLALLGSVLGAYLVHLVNPAHFKLLVAAVILMVGILVLVNKRFGQEDRFPGLNLRTLGLGGLGSLLIGAYDGFLGPGTGTFLMFLFALLGFSLVSASGNARTVNFATNLGSLIFFVLGGQVIWWLGLSLGVANALGATVGARLAMLRGSRLIKWIYALIVVLVIVRLLTVH